MQVGVAELQSVSPSLVQFQRVRTKSSELQSIPDQRGTIDEKKSHWANIFLASKTDNLVDAPEIHFQGFSGGASGQ
jgi:hypothetical protein